MYSRVVNREFNISPENIRAALYYLEGENLIGCIYSEESLKRAEREILESYRMIQQADPDKVWGKVGWHCKNCDYATICTFYNPEKADNPSWDGNMEDLDGGW
jgi:CRISPR/Cas system-associated exonuclease Cas4 (RecB family)